jgi:hypothetical protein
MVHMPIASRAQVPSIRAKARSIVVMGLAPQAYEQVEKATEDIPSDDCLCEGSQPIVGVHGLILL